MENFNLNFEVSSPEEMELYRKEELELLKNTKYICDYVEQEGISWEDVEENISKFSLMLSSVTTCTGCKGLHECRQGHIGYFETVKKDDDGICDICLRACKYKNDEVRRNTYLKSYVYTDFENDMLDLKFDTLIPKDADENYLVVENKIVDYADNFDIRNKGIFLYGSMGVGKTWMMIALCNQLVQSGKRVAFVNTSKLVIENKNRINQKLLDDLVSVDFLVLDDIGQESVNSLSRDELLYPLLESRVLRHKATCFTSNYSIDGLIKHFTESQYGDNEEMKAKRLVERIRALSNEIVIEGKSRR